MEHKSHQDIKRVILATLFTNAILIAAPSSIPAAFGSDHPIAMKDPVASQGTASIVAPMFLKDVHLKGKKGAVSPSMNTRIQRNNGAVSPSMNTRIQRNNGAVTPSMNTRIQRNNGAVTPSMNTHIQRSGAVGPPCGMSVRLDRAANRSPKEPAFIKLFRESKD